MTKQRQKEIPFFPESERWMREKASEGMVLLENKNQILPLKMTQKNIALFGGGAARTVCGGCGSSMNMPRHYIHIADAFREAGYRIVSEKSLADYVCEYERADALFRPCLFAEGLPQSLAIDYYRPGDLEIPDRELEDAARQTDTAIYVVSRTFGEGWDRKLKGDPRPLDENFLRIFNELYHNDQWSGPARSHWRQLRLFERTNEYVNDSYEFTEIEKSNLRRMVKQFSKTILLINAGGPMDMGFLKELPQLGAVMLISYPGQEAGYAVLNALEGRTIPSGKLTDTWTLHYEDNPASDFYSCNGDGNPHEEQYSEGIYVGYRYFDTFGLDVAYPFGYGKSYTEFSHQVQEIYINEQQAELKIYVQNIGKQYAGRESVQVYISSPEGFQEHPYQELMAFAKTDMLNPGEKQLLTISFPIGQMASYHEEKAAFYLEKGEYLLRVGAHSRDTKVAAVIRLDGEAVTEQLTNQLDKAEISLLSSKNVPARHYPEEAEEIAAAPVFQLNADKIACLNTAENGFPYDQHDVTTYLAGNPEQGPVRKEDMVFVNQKQTTRRRHRQTIQYVGHRPGATLADVVHGKLTAEEFVAQMSLEELASWINFESNDQEMMERYGFRMPLWADGPAGIRFIKRYDENQNAHVVFNDGGRGDFPRDYYRSDQPQFAYSSLWPCELLIAQSWDPALAWELGDGMAAEMQVRDLDVLCAPGLNIHRDPLLGRNFEYFSEDPVLSGIMAAAVVQGIQSRPGCGACPKHLALNNQEADRYYTNSIATERTIREIYLKGFSMAVRAAHPVMLMTSYNRINGEHASECFDLCTNIIRGEWNFEGCIRSDGGAGEDHDLSMYAGNELLTYCNAARNIIRKTDHNRYAVELDPGREPVLADEETIYLGDSQKNALRLLHYICLTNVMEKLGLSREEIPKGIGWESYLKIHKSPVKKGDL